MAVTSVNEVSAKGAFPPGGRKYTVTYNVKTDDRQDGPKTVRDSTLLPGPTDTYSYGNESDTGAFRTGVSSVDLVKAEGTKKLWRVAVNFETAGAGTMGGTKQPQVDSDETLPWDLPAEISGDFITHQEDLLIDRDANLVVNSANWFFPEQPQRDVDYPTLIIKRAYQEGTFSLNILASVRNTVNEVVFFGMAPDVWRLIRSPWQELYINSTTPYYTVQYEFAADIENKWAVKPYDMGILDIDGKQPIDFYSRPLLNTPAPLDGYGTFLDIGLAPIRLDGTKAVGWGTDRAGPFNPYPRKDYGALLGVPTTL